MGKFSLQKMTYRHRIEARVGVYPSAGHVIVFDFAVVGLVGLVSLA